MRSGGSTFSQLGFLVRSAGGLDQMILQDYVRGLADRGANHLELWWEPAEAYNVWAASGGPDAFAAVVSDLDFTFSVHLPFIGLDPTSPSAAVSRAAGQEMAAVVRAVRPLQPTHYVVHLFSDLSRTLGGPIGRIWPREVVEGYWSAGLTNAAEALAAVLAELESPRALLAENLTGVPFERLVPLIEALDLGVCLDVGHAFLDGLDSAQFHREWDGRLRALHWGDVIDRDTAATRGELPDHQALDSGQLPWRPLLDQLRSDGFSGQLVLECQRPRYEAIALERLIEHCSGLKQLDQPRLTNSQVGA